MDKRKWVTPEWMESFREHMSYGRRIEELMSSPVATIDVNAPLALIQIEMEAQVALLCRLREKGLLREPRG